MAANSVSLADRCSPLIMALDIGSSSVRCGIYDSTGRAVENKEAGSPYRLETGRDGISRVDPEVLLEALFVCIDTVLARLGTASRDIAAVGCCTFVANVMGLDASDRPVIPLSTYADTSSWPQAERLKTELDQEKVRQRVGCYFHPSYLPSRFLFWKETDSTLFHKVTSWVSLGEYLEKILFGTSDQSGVTHSVASWTGLLNRYSLDWDEELLNHLALEKGTLSRLVDVSESRTGLTKRFAERWPVLRNIPWFPAIGDGAAANLGSAGPGTPLTAVVTLGTTGAVRAIVRGPLPHIPEGLWCYLVDKDRLLPGGALTEGGNVHAWMREALNLNSPVSLEQELDAMQPDAHGLTFLPFFAGERSPGWRGRATATVHGMTLATKPLEILRAGMESVTLRLGLIFERLLPLLKMTAEDHPNDVPVVEGGGAFAASPAWTQMLADVLGHKVERCDLDEISSRGVALMVLEFLEAYKSQEGAISGTVFEPDPDAHEIYRTARERQADLYDTIREFDERECES